jgi:hypothetical protein
MSTLNMVRPVTGAELADRYRPEVLADLVAPNPCVALERIRRRHGAEPSHRGLNLDIMMRLRSFFAERDPSGQLANGLMIVAPHSHWEKGLPILISRSGRHYLVDERRPVTESVYRPVTFALGQAKPVAYEWVDATVEIPDDQYRRLLDVIVDVAGHFGQEARDLGLAINYRFKQPFDSLHMASEEYPESDAPDAPAIVIQGGTRAAGLPEAGMIDMEQVGWPAQDFRAELPQHLTAVYDRVAGMLDRLDTDTLDALRREL